MNIINLMLSVIVGALFFFIVPVLTKQLIDYKEKKNKRKFENIRYEAEWKYQLFSAIAGCIVSYVVLQSYELWKAVFIIIFCLLACIGTVVDNKVRIIANELVIFMFALGIIFRAMDAGLDGLINSFLTVIGVFTFFVFSFFILKLIFRSLVPPGAGDLKLMMVMGILLGYPNIIDGIFVSMIIMCVYIFAGLSASLLTIKSSIPMAGFIMVGIVVGLISEGINLWRMLGI